MRVRALKEICPCRVSNKTITIKSNLLHLHIASSKVLLLLNRKKRENVIYCSLGLALINSRSLTLPIAMFLTPGERGYSWVLGASGRNARWRRCCCSKTGRCWLIYIYIKSCGGHDLLIMSFNVRWVTVWYKVMICVNSKMLRCVTHSVMVHQLTWKMKWRGLCKGESRFSFW